MNTESNSPRRKRWLRLLAGAVVVLGVLVVGLYFVATSPAFFKGVILPKVGAALNAELTVADARISPFSQVVLRDLKVVPRGADPLLAAAEVRARYRLMSILRGRIVVQEVTVVSPTLTLVEKADGTSNLDPLLRALGGAEQPGKPQPAGASAPPSLDIQAVKLSNATVRRTTQLKGGGRDVLEVSNLNVTLDRLKNGQPGKLDLNAALTVDRSARPNTPAALANGRLSGGFAFDLTAALRPGTVKGNLALAVEKATGPFAEAAALTAQLDAEATPTEIRQLAVRFSKGGASLGQLRVSGPFDATKLEGRLKVELTGVDRKLLNLAGAAGGLDFGTTTLNATGDVAVARAGAQLSAAGRLELARFQVTRQGQTTPTLDLRCDFGVTVDSAAQSALLSSLTLSGTQGQRPLLQAALSAPMTVAWGNTSNAIGEAALNLTLAGLDLADWKPFLGGIAPAGRVDLTAKLLSQQAGKLLQFDVQGGVQDLLVVAGTNRFAGLSAILAARGQAHDLKQFSLAACTAELTQHNRQLLAAQISGAFDTAARSGGAEATARVELPVLLQMLARPDVTASAGTLQARVNLAHNGTTNTITGRLALAGFTGRLATTKLADFGLETDLDVLKAGNQLQIRRLAGQLTGAGQPGGSFEAGGHYNTATGAGDVTLKLAGINQSTVAPFLAAALGEKKLVSVGIGATASASLAANGDASVRADLQVTNLVVHDPKGMLPATPLEARLLADAAVAKRVAQLRQLQLTLTPTDRAKNQLGLTGTVDYSKTNAITGNLKLAAEALDLTHYYGLFADKDQAGAAQPRTAPAGTAPRDPTREPDAIRLPFQNFTVEASIGRLHLREVAMTNFQATVRLDGGRVGIKPCQLVLNGAPVTAAVDADLGVPGFKYDLMLEADKVPLAPLVNSFVPERKGQLAGTATATARVKGAGVTGASLQQHLDGQFNLVATNLNLSIAQVRSRLLKAVINVVVGLPDLIRDPTAAVGNLLSRLTGAPAQRTSWADQLTAAPIQVIAVRGSAGRGRVELQQAEVRSAAFQALAAGDITLAAVLTNSTLQIPVSVALSRGLADKIGLAGADTSTNASYVALPDFLQMKGTVGEPKPEINKLVLVGLAARTGAGVAKQIGGAGTEKAAGVLEAVGSLLGGGARPARPATNAPAGAPTNAPAQPRSLLDLLGPRR